MSRDDLDRPIPPQGDSEADKAARVRFWLERGNEKLAQAGKHHLHWRHLNGHYWIEPIETAVGR